MIGLLGAVLQRELLRVTQPCLVPLLVMTGHSSACIRDARGVSVRRGWQGTSKYFIKLVFAKNISDCEGEIHVGRHQRNTHWSLPSMRIANVVASSLPDPEKEAVPAIEAGNIVSNRGWSL